MVDPRRLSVTPMGSEISPSNTQGSFDTSRSEPPNIKLPLQGQQQQQQHKQQLSPNARHTNSQTWLDRGSGEMDLDLDLESGTVRARTGGVPLENLSRSSMGRRSSIGDDDHGEGDEGSDDASDDASEWNSHHPCFPHRNPHVPLDSPEYETTRVIRIARDYMYSGDISPAFSNIYPEILDPFVSESTFREVVKRVNDDLYEAHSPWGIANIVGGVVGMLTLWVYEDAVDTTAKRKIEEVERYLEKVNGALEKESGARFIPLRRTGYLNMDIQIPDPGMSLTDDEGEDDDNDERMVSEGKRGMKLHLEGMSPIKRPPALMVNGQFP